jgi:hypothetical protein
VIDWSIVMKRLAIAVFACLPTAALADYSCTITQQCGLGQCEPFPGDPVVMHEAGDTWQINFGGTVYEGYVSTTVEGTGELNIVLPPQNAVSGLVSLYESGAVAMTFHALNGTDVVAITGFGSCQGTGG